MANLVRDRVKQQRKGRKRLAAVLGPEAEDDDLAFANIYLNKSCLSRYPFGSEGPAGEKDLFRVGRVAGDNSSANFLLGGGIVRTTTPPSGHPS